MYIKFKIIVYRAKIQKKCAEYKKLAVSFNKIRYAQECTKKKGSPVKPCVYPKIIDSL